MLRKRYLFIILMVFGQFGFCQDYTKAIQKAKFLINAHQSQTHIPGVQVAVSIGDSVIWSEGFGYSDLDKKIPVNSQTTFRITSVSKPLTSLALVKLVQEQKVDLDKQIGHYLKDIPEAWREITPRQLMSSTSGIRHYNSDDPEYNQVNYPDVTSALERFKDDPLLFEPGTDYLYSSYGWVLLSAVMEQASGQSFFDLMQEVWTDLDMQNTTFDYPNQTSKTISTFYIHDKKEGRVEAPKDNRSYMYAGGGYLSTAEDLIKAGQAILKEHYIDKKYIQELLNSQKLPNDTETHYGLGWEFGTSRLETPIVYHSGSMSTARSHFIIYPKEDIVFAYLANTGDHVFFNDREAQNIAELFVEAKRNKKYATSKTDALPGQWEISTTSLRDKKSKGTLQLSKNKNGVIEGQIEFKRSRKTETYPVILADTDDNKAHLIAVSPMFIDFFLTFEENTFSGIWLHDFNVKGIREEDKYWNPRTIKGERY